jgi:hypothetical protein
MVRNALDRRSLLVLVKKTLSEFPPQKDSDNVRPFRSISVDHLEGKVTHPQFKLLYIEENTAEQITDAILLIFNTGRPRIGVTRTQADETSLAKWPSPRRYGRTRPFWNESPNGPQSGPVLLPESD